MESDGGSVSQILDLYDVAADGTVTTTQLDSLTHAPASSNYYLRPESVTPDSDGILALFVRAQGAAQDEQWNGKYFGATSSNFTLPGPWLPTVTSIDGYGIGRGTESTDSLVSRNLRTGSLLWQSSAQGDAVVALDGGGAGLVSGSGSLVMLDQTGVTTEVDALSVAPVPYVYGSFHVRDGNNTLVAVPWKPIDDATAFQSGAGAKWAALPGYFSNYNAIDLNTTQSPGFVFDTFMRTFAGLVNSTVVTVSVEGDQITGAGQHATFTLLGTSGLVQFSVESIRLDQANHVFSVKTLPGHPLFGWRYWKVAQLVPGRIRVETGAFDKPAAGMSLPYFLSRNDQIKTWQEYLLRIRDQLGAQQDFSRPNASGLVKGFWGYDKFEILRNVCGSEPVPGTWVCQ